MTVRLLLVAHGETPATRRHRFAHDEDLDSRGWAAATAAGHILDPATELFCAPDRRCRSTAQALISQRATGSAPRAEALTDDRLADWDLGSWAGRSLQDVAAADPAGFAAWRDDPDARPHNGESLAALLTRTDEYLTDMARRTGHHTAVTHPAVVRAAIVDVLGASAAAFWRIDVPPLGRAFFTAHGGRWNYRCPA